MRIKSVTARQIINAKGHPALEVEVQTGRNKAVSSAPVASSKSKYEFFDAYDHDLTRFNGETLDVIVDNVNRVIGPEFIGKNVLDQEELDNLLLSIDSTLERTHLGVNTITATSQAIAKLGAIESDLPLFKYIRVLHDYSSHAHSKLNSAYVMPHPVVTVYKSSHHDLSHHLPVQEVLVFPKGGFSYVRDLVELFNTLHLLQIEDSKHSLKSFLENLHDQLNNSKFKLKLGIDMAASRYKRQDLERYTIPSFSGNGALSGDFKKVTKAYIDLIKDFDLGFVEDLFDEDDYSAWKDLMDHVDKENKAVQVVSDDFTATNIERLEKIIQLDSTNNVVLKPSQAGTITEVIHFASKARKHGLNLTASYRHGETEDTFISDLAVGVGAEMIRTGYFKGSEHNAKLNRLLQIETEV